ncbi:N-6 DNA methylase [Streptomyces zaehneri]|uniref:N-6 DNA methylase n=1 Tax=Streptomyces zaehneri TaxID=3051180 RepID=UPI0028D6127F|nr:N-6 DNA methylase [Streptomyces sp. DSM 40713]
MNNIGDVFVSRSDIARMAGVRRPAVTNWERRHPDFPVPLAPDPGDPTPEVFRAEEVLRWLSGRPIPSNALQSGEPAGATYGDRFRSALSGSRSGSLLAAVDQLAWRDADRLRGQWRMYGYLFLLLFLVFVQSREPRRWAGYVDDPEQALRDLDRGEADGLPQLSEVIQFLNRNSPESSDESRKAFDRLLVRLRDLEPSEAGEYFTPPSVSRVMARALAGNGSTTLRLYDPFCRTGELLCAYLDAVAEQGGKPPGTVSGRALGEGPQMLARMHLELHDAQRPTVLLGPRVPAQPGDFGDLSGSFDAVITNPPFGGWSSWSQLPPQYWRYGEARTKEFDWLQYVVSCLAPDGRAAILMPAGAASRGSAERETRASMVEDGVIECVMALPPQLFERTAIQTHIWFLRSPLGRPGDVLFVDGTRLGSMASRTRRALSGAEVDRLVRSYVSWRESQDHLWSSTESPGLSRVASHVEIVANDHRLEPALYVRESLPAVGTFDDQAATKDRLAALSAQLQRLHAEARNVDGLAEERLRRYGL